MHTVLRAAALAATILGAAVEAITSEESTGSTTLSRLIQDHVPEDDLPAVRRVTYERESFYKNNVSTVQALAATQGEHGELILLTDAQINAIIVADAAPTEPATREWDADLGVLALNKQHVDHINKVMEANFSLSEIHDLFHSSDNLPINLTDEEVDAAIARHPAAEDKWIERENFINETTAPYWGIYRAFAHYNITPAAQIAATWTEDGKFINLTEYQASGIIAAYEFPTPPWDQPEEEWRNFKAHLLALIIAAWPTAGEPINPSEEKVNEVITAAIDLGELADADMDKEREHLNFVYRCLEANYTRAELNALFHKADCSVKYELTESDIDTSIYVKETMLTNGSNITELWC